MADPARRPTMALALAAALGVLVAAVGVALMFAAKPQLPDPLAVHWGWDGQPDRWASFASATVTAALLTAIVPLVLVGLGAVMHPSGRAPIAGVAAALAIFVGGLSFGGLLAQRPGEGPTAFPPQWVIPATVVALGVGVLLARWGRYVPPPTGGLRPRVPEQAAQLDVPPTARIAWTARTAVPARAVVVITSLAVAPLVVVAFFGQPWLLLVAAAILLLLALTWSARVKIDAEGLRVSSLGLTWSRVPIERVASAEAGSVSPLREFGGWGWRMGRDGRRGYVTRAGEALVVHRVGEPDVIVTVDGAAEAAAALNTLAARVR